jgi:resuscitation-promoting factor RpfB
VSARIAHLSKSKTVLAVLVAAIVLAVAGTTVGYAALNKSVTLSLDGRAQQVSAMGGTVGEVLEAEGVEVTERDRVAPSLDEPVEEGTRITVRFARPLDLVVDGEKKTHWVTSGDVAGALGEIGRRFSGADLSTSRGASISRDGMRLAVVTPKTLQVKLGAKDVKKAQVTALTVKGALKELGVKMDKQDQVEPGLGQELSDGDKLVFTDIRTEDKRVKAEAIDFETVERDAPGILEGETETVRSGRDGARDVTYRMTYRNGELVGTKVLRAEVVREPVDEVIKVGTKEPAPEPEPEPAAPAPNYAAGSTVWDQLAQCESGGNWAINTGNGYYGGLQFSLSTWQAYGGPGMPHEQSRETQIAIAEKVQAAQGWGAWPSCSAQLGLS